MQGTVWVVRAGARIGVNGERERRIWAPVAYVHTARNRARNPLSPWVSPKCVKVCSPGAHELVGPTLSFGHCCSDRGALSQVLRKGRMHQMWTPDDENATLAWLEDALGQAYTHGQMTTLAYLEAVMEDVVFVMEMTVRKASLIA
jgi:hypothetical protein